jgi:hypothetical protein
MIVTSYYDLYNKPENFMDFIYSFYDLGISGLNIIVFTHPNLVKKFRIFPSSVKVIGIPLETFELYNIGMKYDRELPNNRNENIHTKEYFSFVNTKTEFILKASEITDDNTFIWIDFTILKNIKYIDRFINKLKSINEKSFDKITMPGSWGFGRNFSVDDIHSRFCGELFIIPKKHINTFFTHTRNVHRDFCTLPIYKLTWETNIWSIVEFCACKDIINWYFAEYDDTILNNIDTINH